jgi:hypothetical protein
LKDKKMHHFFFSQELSEKSQDKYMLLL